MVIKLKWLKISMVAVGITALISSSLPSSPYMGSLCSSFHFFSPSNMLHADANIKLDTKQHSLTPSKQTRYAVC